MEAVKDALQLAIRQGAPVYNQGRPDACYDIYRTTASTLLEAGIVPDSSAAVLREALQSSSGQSSPDAQAWTMRRAFDSILDGRSEVMGQVSQSLPSGAVDYPVLDLTNGPSTSGPAGLPTWFSLDDVIMGGMSSSSISYEQGSQALVFSGNVTTDRNGGFASVRSAPWAGWSLLSKAQGMRLLVQGDDRMYKITAKTDDTYDGVQYQQDFLTGPAAPPPPPQQRPATPPSFPVPAGWQVVDLPFRSFTPNFRGRPVRNQPPLVGSQIRQLGLMVSKFAAADGGMTPGFRSGPFRLALRSTHGII